MNENNTFLQFVKSATNIAPILEMLKLGVIIRRVIGLLVQACAIIVGIALLYFWVRCFAFLEVASFLGKLAILIWQLFFLYASFLSLKAIFLRGKEIKNLPDSNFIVIPIIATIMVLSGEVFFIFLGAMSVPVMLLVWLGGAVSYEIIPTGLYVPNFGDTFFASLVAFGYCWVAGFLVYLAMRCIQEWTMAFFSIAHNVDLLQKRSNGKEQPVATPETPNIYD